jgi:hypothetical protein
MDGPEGDAVDSYLPAPHNQLWVVGEISSHRNVSTEDHRVRCNAIAYSVGYGFKRTGFKSTARARVRPSFAAAKGAMVDQPGGGLVAVEPPVNVTEELGDISIYLLLDPDGEASSFASIIEP